jgi:predicted dithiol-disulfide oxidoreductase (DUF899 family)
LPIWAFDSIGLDDPRDTACPSCSSIADGIGALTRLHVRNPTLVGVSHAPYEKIAAFRVLYQPVGGPAP